MASSNDQVATSDLKTGGLHAVAVRASECLMGFVSAAMVSCMWTLVALNLSLSERREFMVVLAVVVTVMVCAMIHLLWLEIYDGEVLDRPTSAGGTSALIGLCLPIAALLI